MTEPICTPAELRLIGNIALLASRMNWREESECMYEALAEVAQTKAPVYFTWLVSRCLRGDVGGAADLLDRMTRLPDADKGMLEMASCYVQYSDDTPIWPTLAKRIVAKGVEAFGYETARSMLDEHAPVRKRA